jgi:hypothetical protein
MDHAQHLRLRRTRVLRRTPLAALLLAAALTVAVEPTPTLAQANEAQPATPRRADRAEPLQSPQRAGDAKPDAPSIAQRSENVPLLKLERMRRVGQQSVRVPIEAHGAKQLAPADLLVVAGSAHVDKAQDGSVVLEQAKRSTSVVSTVGAKGSALRSLVTADKKVQLPWLVVDSQESNQQNVVRSARPFIKLARAVQWDAKREMHEAQFLVGLDAESGDSGALAEPLVANFVVSCDRVEPHSITFTSIGSEGDRLVGVECSAQVKNEEVEQQISVRVQGAEYDYSFAVPHRPGRYELQASTSSVLGMGLGELTLTAVQREEDGTPIVTKEPLVVPLKVSDGVLAPDSLTIPANSAQGMATVHLRGSGQLQLVAGIAERESDPVPIRVRWPILLASMAPLGGGVGGFMAMRWQRKLPARPRSRKYQHVMSVVEGAVVGTVLVLSLMLVPAISIVPRWARTAEIAWFVVAVFAGFLGLELLDRIARLFFRATTPTQPRAQVDQK